LVDDSYVRLYYTSKLRPNRAGLLLLGDSAVTQSLPIPMGEGISSWEYDCPSACTQNWPTLHVFAVTLHMHGVGKQMWGTQWRDGQLVRETDRIDFWDFKYQQQTYVQFDILPGDSINTHCIYKRSTEKDVKFSFGSRDEMCIQFVAFFPYVSDFVCGYIHPQINSTADTFCGAGYVEGLPPQPTKPDPVRPHVTFGDDISDQCGADMNAAGQASLSCVAIAAVLFLAAKNMYTE